MSKVTVTVNGLTLVHRDSGATSTATLPDVVATPPTQAPTPFPNVARARDLAGGTANVRIDGDNPVMVAGSTFARSEGGEPGAGGVTSGTRLAEAALLSHSFDVSIEGRGAARLTDKMLHNHGNTIDCSGISVAIPLTRSKASTLDLALAKKNRRQPKPSPDKTWKPLHGCDTNLGDFVSKSTGQYVDPNNLPADWHPRIKVHDGLKPKIAPYDGTHPSFGLQWLRDNRKVRFVGRYINADPDGHWPLDAAEISAIHGLGVKVFLIFEKSKYRAVEGGDEKTQHHFGVHDAREMEAALAKMGEGHHQRAVYFTVDFRTIDPAKKAAVAAAKKKGPGTHDLPTPISWNYKPRDYMLIESKQGKRDSLDTVGQLVTAYFKGIYDELNAHVKSKAKKSNARIGVYGSRHSVSQVLDSKYAKFGWQFNFGESADASGNSYYQPDQHDGFPHGDEAYDPRCHLLQYNITPNFSPNYPDDQIGIRGGGYLDLDAAIKAEFGAF